MAAKFRCPFCGTRQEIDPDILVDEQECVECGKLMRETGISERPVRRRVRRIVEEDEWEDEDDIRKPAEIPGAVIGAGVIWIVFGSLSVLGAIIELVLFAVRAAGEEGGGISSRTSGVSCGALVGAAFIHVGIQTIRGTAKDVVGNAVGSFVFGMLYLIGAILCLFLSLDIAKFVGIICFFLALALFSAGIMALVSRSEYLDYRSSRRRRRRRR